MFGFKEKVRNRLIENRSHISAELPSTDSNLRRWVVIFANKGSIDQSIPDHEFSILDFELDKKLVDEYFSEEDKLNQKRTYVNSEDELYSALGLLGIEASQFDAPWNNDCPL